MVGLLKTRVKSNKSKTIAQSIVLGWTKHHNYTNAYNGRIWLLWDDHDYQVDIVVQGAQYLHSNILRRDKKVECCMTMMYRFNTIELRKTLWDDLGLIVVHITNTWLIWGDLNALLQCQDRLHGRPVTKAKIQDFATCVQDLSLNKLARKGDFYSLFNK